MNNSINMRQVLLLSVILLSGILIAVTVIKTAPKPQRNTAAKQARLVETTALERSSERPQWLGGGEIAAAQRVQLAAQVSGRIVKVAATAIPGAELDKGQLLASIEKSDYQLQVQQQQAAVIQAQATLDLEKGSALLAKEEYELAARQIKTRRGVQVAEVDGSGIDESAIVDSSLVLREPQIAAAKAGLKTAQANLALARLNLKRTEIKMPFKGQIISRSANAGSQVSTNNELFDLVATDEFWLQVKISQQFLPLLDTTQAVIIQQGNYQREAEILHSLIEVDARDRQAKVLISIKNPLENKLLLGSYVDCILFAQPIDDVYVVENKFIKEGGYVWVVNDNKLFKRQLVMAYQGRDKSWVESGFSDGDVLLTSNLGVITEGTPVRLISDRVSEDRPAADKLTVNTKVN